MAHELKRTSQPIDMISPSRTNRLRTAVCVGVFALLFSMRLSIILASPGKVIVQPGDNIGALVNSHPAGTTFVIKPGVYRLQAIIPKDGDSFVGEPGVVFNGAALLSAFSRKGSYWIASVAVGSGRIFRGRCDQDHPACTDPHDLFIDDVPFQRVADLSAVSRGKWYLDYRTGKAYIRDNPAGHQVEMSQIPYAFYGSAKDVTIRGLTIEKYADVAGEGAIEGRSKSGVLSDGWMIEDNVIEFNHGMGIRLGDRMKVLNNKIDHNGQMGLGGSGSGILVAGNEIAYNNYAGYSYGWEAGGTKFTFTKGLVVRDNFVHNNDGPGLWTDIDNQDTLYEHNRTTDNKEAGILHEISYHAVIRDNIIEKDGFDGSGKKSPWYGAGIIVTGSENVEVYGNTVTDCMNGIIGLQPNRKKRTGGFYFLRNLYVHDNTVTQKAGIAAGILKSPMFDNSVFTSWNNRFSNNTFHLGSASGKYFEWMNVLQSLSAWRNLGQNRQKAHG